jgi:hypothetical protein
MGELTAEQAQPYADPNHPSNTLRPRTRCWGCGTLGCVGKHWGNWCFRCNNERIGRINATFERLTESKSVTNQ